MTTTTFPEFASSSSSRAFARYTTLGGRCALGFVFFSSGLMGLLNLLPAPSTPLPAGAVAFGGALLGTGYMFPLIKATETLAGALLLSNRFVPLALTLLAPVLVNICLFHAFLTPGQLGMPIALLCVELFLAWSYRAAYRPLLTPKSTPGAQ